MGFPIDVKSSIPQQTLTYLFYVVLRKIRYVYKSNERLKCWEVGCGIRKNYPN